MCTHQHFVKAKICHYNHINKIKTGEMYDNQKKLPHPPESVSLYSGENVDILGWSVAGNQVLMVVDDACLVFLPSRVVVALSSTRTTFIPSSCWLISMRPSMAATSHYSLDGHS